MMKSPLVVSLTPSTTAAAEARSVLRTWLRDCVEDDRTAAELAVSELVSNAVKHTASPEIRIIAMAQGQRVRCEVEDCSGSPPQPRDKPVRADRVGGRGLQLVSELSEAWGWEPAGEGKRVWFELTCRPQSLTAERTEGPDVRQSRARHALGPSSPRHR